MIPSSGHPPDRAVQTRHMAEHLHGFLRDLTDHGVGVSAAMKIHFLRAIALSEHDDLANLYWIGRISLTTSPAEHEVFDPIFWHWFSTMPPAPVAAPEPAPAEDGSAAAPNTARDDDDHPHTRADRGSGQAASPATRLGRLTFRPTTAAETQLIALLRRDLPAALPRIASRRRRPARRGDVLDLRRVVREAARTHGEVLSLRWRHRPARQRRVALLIDVSGSMKQHSPDLLRFGHAVLTSCERAEVFTFGTRLTHASAALRAADPDTAVQALASVVLDADGGTRIGYALRGFLTNRRFRTMARGAVVIVFSDGLERGDCSTMTDAVQRLARLSHRLLWWSPLACDPAYRPLTRAMAAITDHLDALAGVCDMRTAHDQVAGAFSLVRGPRARPAARRLAHDHSGV
jgi:uncharacterized protein with von Willebrand factor type A (vWA) domain